MNFIELGTRSGINFVSASKMIKDSVGSLRVEEIVVSFLTRDFGTKSDLMNFPELSVTLRIISFCKRSHGLASVIRELPLCKAILLSG